MNFKDKVVVLTGAGNGIGRQVTLDLLAKGAFVAGIDISKEGMEETKKLAGDLGKHFSIHPMSITDKEAVAALPELVIKEHGRIDGLLNVAGIIQPFVYINDLDFDKIERVMNVNFYGTLYLIKATLPYLLQSKEEAFIGNVSSMGGFLPVPGQGIYGASKAAVKLMTESLYAELKDTNVRVSIIFPGGVATNITANSGVKLDLPQKTGKPAKQYKMLSVEKASEIIIKGLEKEKFRIVVGSDARAMDKIYRLNPKFAVDLITKKMKDLL